MMPWRARLAALMAEPPAADRAESADSLRDAPAPHPIGANGPIGMAVDRAREAEQRRAAFLAHAATEAAEALAAPDPDLAAERDATAAALAAEAKGELGKLLPVAVHQHHLAGVRGSAMQRPPCWADHQDRPGLGCRCSCCAGRRWWAAQRPSMDCTGIGPGWCCATCHPAPPGAAINEVRT